MQTTTTIQTPAGSIIPAQGNALGSSATTIQTPTGSIIPAQGNALGSSANKKQDPERVDHNIAVHYQWSGPDGTICRARTIVSAKSRASRHVRHAVKTFFRQHRHVQPDTIAYSY